MKPSPMNVTRFYPDTLRHLHTIGKKALRSDSNDAEHDALYEIVEMLGSMQSKGQSKPTLKKGKRV